MSQPTAVTEAAHAAIRRERAETLPDLKRALQDVEHVLHSVTLTPLQRTDAEHARGPLRKLVDRAKP